GGRQAGDAAWRAGVSWLCQADSSPRRMRCGACVAAMMGDPACVSPFSRRQHSELSLDEQLRQPTLLGRSSWLPPGRHGFQLCKPLERLLGTNWRQHAFILRLGPLNCGPLSPSLTPQGALDIREEVFGLLRDFPVSRVIGNPACFDFLVGFGLEPPRI